MARVIVRYKVKPDCVEENLRLVRAVYEELHQEDGRSPLPELDSFKRFQAGIPDRCEEQPVVLPARAVGSYGGGGEAQLLGA